MGSGAGADEDELATFAATAAAVPTFVVDLRSGVIRWANPAALERLGSGDEPLVGSGAWALVHPDDLPKLLAAQAASAEAAEGRTRDAVLAPAPYRVRWRDGWVSSEVIAAITDDGADGGDVTISCLPVEHHRAASRAVELLVSAAPMPEVVDQVLRSATIGTTIRRAAFSWDEQGQRAVRTTGLADALAWSDDERDPWHRALADGGVVAVRIDELRPSLAALAIDAGLAACVAVAVPDPGSAQDGCFVLWGQHPTQVRTLPHRVEGDERSLLQLALARRHEHAQLVAAATTDALTGVLNRRELVARIEARLARDESTTLHFLDLDGFKPVNDEHGHEAGDQVLRVVAARLVEAAGPDDLVGRLGGDELAVVHDGSLDAAALVAAIEAPIALEDGATVTVGASVGVASADDGHRTADALLSAADVSMYGEKRRRVTRSRTR